MKISLFGTKAQGLLRRHQSPISVSSKFAFVLIIAGTLSCKTDKTQSVAQKQAPKLPSGEVENAPSEDKPSDDGDLSSMIETMKNHRPDAVVKNSQNSSDTNLAPLTMWVVATHLHIRAKPTENSAIQGYLHHLNKVSVLELGHWAKIGEDKWVNANWLSKEKP